MYHLVNFRYATNEWGPKQPWWCNWQHRRGQRGCAWQMGDHFYYFSYVIIVMSSLSVCWCLLVLCFSTEILTSKYRTYFVILCADTDAKFDYLRVVNAIHIGIFFWLVNYWSQKVITSDWFPKLYIDFICWMSKLQCGVFYMWGWDKAKPW